MTKVLFLQSVEGTAQAGDIKDVAAGFARNYLFPRHVAVVATPSVIADQKKREIGEKKKEEKFLAEARELAAQIKKTVVTVHARAGEDGRLFGSVTAAEVVKQLKRDAGIVIDKKGIQFSEPIKSVGEHSVEVILHPEVVENLRVVVAIQ